MKAPSEDIKNYIELEESALGLSYGNNMFVGLEPTTPDICITLFDYQNYHDLGLQTQGYEYVSLQIRARGRSYLSTWNLLQSVVIALHGKKFTTTEGTLYTMISCINGPASFDHDENGRVRLIANFNLQRR